MRICDMDLVLKRIVLILIGVILSIMVSAAFLIPEKQLAYAEECEPAGTETGLYVNEVYSGRFPLDETETG